MSKKDTPTKIFEGRIESNDSINIHELLKQQVYNEKITPQSQNNYNSGERQGKWIQQNKPYSPLTYGISDQFVMLDSFLKTPDSNLSKGEFRWNLAIQGATSANPNLIGVTDILSTIVQITLGSFSIPILPVIPYPLPYSQINTSLLNNGITLANNNNIVVSQPPIANPYPTNFIETPLLQTQQYPISVVNKSFWINNPFTQIPFGNIISIQIREAGIQSYSDINGNRHHFDYKIWSPSITEGTNPNQAFASPSFLGGDKYIFTEPLIDLQTITLVFRNPNIPIMFDPDIIECKVLVQFNDIIIANPPSIPIGTPATLTFSYTKHNLLTEDRIYIKNINTGIDILDTYLTDVNGILVGDIPLAYGVSQKALTEVPLTDNNSFCTDPFIQFNTIPIGTIDNFKLINGIITATIAYDFGYTNISFLYNESTTIPNIGNFIINKTITGSYSILITNTYPLVVTNATSSLIQLSTSCLVYIAKRRLRIPASFRCVVNKITNYISL